MIKSYFVNISLLDISRENLLHDSELLLLLFIVLHIFYAFVLKLPSFRITRAMVS